MPRLRKALALALYLTVACAAQTPGKEELSSVFAGFQRSDTPGCAVGVESPGVDRWSAAWGMADLEHNVPNTSSTVFEAGSVSKQFTAAAALLLVERGQISLEDDIRKYFPELPVYEKPITVRELMNHTSGLRDWGEIEAVAGWPRTTREYTHAYVLEILSRQKALNYTPGTAWSYTNSGYNLLAMLIERVTKSSLQVFSRKELFEPLGMKDTQWRDHFRKIVPNRAIAYATHEGGWEQMMPFEDVYGNGGLLTTVDDLLKWNRNMTTGAVHPWVFQTMQVESTLSDGKHTGYGLGLFLQDFQGLSEVNHAGATAGYRAWLGRIPAKGFSIAVLCNASSADTTDLAHRVARIYLHLPDAAPRVAVADKHVAGAVGDERVPSSRPGNLSEFEGVYTSIEAETTFTVVAEGGHLKMRRQPAADFELTPTRADAFDATVGHIRFLRDGGGTIVALSLSGPRVWDLRFQREQSRPVRKP